MWGRTTHVLGAEKSRSRRRIDANTTHRQRRRRHTQPICLDGADQLFFHTKLEYFKDFVREHVEIVDSGHSRIQLVCSEPYNCITSMRSLRDVIEYGQPEDETGVSGGPKSRPVSEKPSPFPIGLQSDFRHTCQG